MTMEDILSSATLKPRSNLEFLKIINHFYLKLISSHNMIYSLKVERAVKKKESEFPREIS